MNAAAIHWALSIALAPLVVGAIQWTRARLQGRCGASPLQPYRDLWKLVRKGPVWPETASLVFGLAPYLLFVIYALLAALIASVSVSTDGGGGDLITLIFLLALTRFSVGLAALDAGTPFAALGGSRTMFMHLLAEPTLVVLASAYALQTHSLQLILAGEGSFLHAISRLLIGAGLLGAILVETGRLPFDNSETKLELTMIESAVALDYGGLELAVWEWATAIRLTAFFALCVAAIQPANLTSGLNWPALLSRLVLYLLLIVGLAVWEATRPRYRLRALVAPAVVPFILALSAILFDFMSRNF
ncbi:MAG TPA: NADH-quinone oxidoreductase subunit H [Anaerolineae bacterium]|nr:NADH-quinone oxidoreductase subunit H [Anaerolineae bacterium]